ncbi:MAG: hypothetical protein ACXWVD_00265 [Telluria sp.]
MKAYIDRLIDYLYDYLYECLPDCRVCAFLRGACCGLAAGILFTLAVLWRG